MSRGPVTTAGDGADDSLYAYLLLKKAYPGLPTPSYNEKSFTNY